MPVNIQEVEVNSADVKSQHVKVPAKPLAHVQIIFGTPGFGLIRRKNQSNLRKSWDKGERSKFRQEKAITGLKGIISIN